MVRPHQAMTTVQLCTRSTAYNLPTTTTTQRNAKRNEIISAAIRSSLVRTIRTRPVGWLMRTVRITSVIDENETWKNDDTSSSNCSRQSSTRVISSRLFEGHPPAVHWRAPLWWSYRNNSQSARSSDFRLHDDLLMTRLDVVTADER